MKRTVLFLVFGALLFFGSQSKSFAGFSTAQGGFDRVSVASSEDEEDIDVDALIVKLKQKKLKKLWNEVNSILSNDDDDDDETAIPQLKEILKLDKNSTNAQKLLDFLDDAPSPQITKSTKPTQTPDTNKVSPIDLFSWQNDRFSWPIEFLCREPEHCNRVYDKGATDSLNVRVTSLFLSQNGKTVACGTDKGDFRLWDVSTGKELARISDAMLTTVKFTMTNQNNTKAITRDIDNQLLVWNLNPVKKLLDLDVSGKYYHSVVFSADGKSLYFGDLKGRIAFYDLNSDSTKPQKIYQVLQNPITYLQISVNGLRLLAGYENNSVNIWDLFMDGDPIYLNLDSELICAEFTQNNNELGTLEKNGAFRIWNFSIRQETFQRSLVGSEKEKIEVFTFSHNGKIAAFGSSTGTVSFLSIAKNSIFDKLTVPGMKEPVPILDLKFSEDDKYLYVGTKYGVWKVLITVNEND